MLFALYDDFKCLLHGEVFVHLRVQLSDQGGCLDLIDRVERAAELLQLTPQEFHDRLKSFSDRQSLCRRLFDQLIVVKTAHQNGDESIIDHIVMVDPKLQPMSDVLQELRQQRYKLQIDQNELVHSEFFEWGTQRLGVNLKILAESPKVSKVTIINRRLFKVRFYLIGNSIKELKIAALPERIFDWNVIYVEAETSSSTKSLVMAVTERDLRFMVQELMQRQHAGEQLLKEETDILSSKVHRKRLVEFINDALVIDDGKHCLKLSMTHLQSRMRDRILLNKYFRLVGGRYLRSFYAIGEDKPSVRYLEDEGLNRF